MSKKVLYFSLIFLVFPSMSLAAVCSTADVGQWIKCIIDNLVTLVLWPVFFGLVVIMFIWAGFLYLTAKGDPAKVTQATKALIWAVVGVAVGLLAFSAVYTIKIFLGVT